LDEFMFYLRIAAVGPDLELTTHCVSRELQQKVR
jgi:hypothetical protein